MQTGMTALVQTNDFVSACSDFVWSSQQSDGREGLWGRERKHKVTLLLTRFLILLGKLALGVPGK